LNTIILEETEHGEVPVDVYQKLADNRVLFLFNTIDDKLASDITATLLLKDREDTENKIVLFINSDGGDIRNIFMIYDMMQMVEAPIETVCIGSAQNEAALLLAAGTPGLRLATKHAIIGVGQLVHEWMAYSDLTDAKQILDLSSKDNKRMMEILAKSCGKPLKEITSDFERKVFMDAKEALKYGLIDKVI
jgi:ATP-dependent Clp protease protease subunit